MYLWTRILPAIRKPYSPSKKQMSPFDDIRSVRTACYTVRVASSQRGEWVQFRISHWFGEAEAGSRTSPALQLQGRRRTRLTSPIRTMISCHVRTGWHRKEPPSFDRDGETSVNVVVSVLVLLLWFLTLRYIVFIAKGKIIHAAGSWSNSRLWISIFDHKIRSNHCFKSHPKLLLHYCTGHSLS